MEILLAPWSWAVVRVQEGFRVDTIRITIHVMLSISFFIYESMVLSNEAAMCDEMRGTYLFYWCYITYYLLMFRIINFLLALVTLCIHRVNEGPIDDADIEKQALNNSRDSSH